MATITHGQAQPFLGVLFIGEPQIDDPSSVVSPTVVGLVSVICETPCSSMVYGQCRALFCDMRHIHILTYDAIVPIIKLCLSRIKVQDIAQTCNKRRLGLPTDFRPILILEVVLMGIHDVEYYTIVSVVREIPPNVLYHGNECRQGC